MAMIEKLSLRSVIVTCAVGLVLLATASLLIRSEPKYPDGPAPLPVLGNIVYWRKLQKNLEPELLKLRDRWGYLCMLWLGSAPVLIINSPRVAKELLNERGAIYSSRPEMNHFRKSVWPWRLVSTPAGEDFRYLRKLYNTALSPQNALAFRKYQDHESMILLVDLLDNPQEFLRGMERYTMSVIFSAGYGVRLDRLDHPILIELNGLLDATMKYFEPGTLPIDFVPMLQYLPSILQPWHRTIVPLVERESALHLAFLNTLRGAAAKGSAPECFAKHMVQVEGGMEDSKASHVLAMLIGAGADTTGSILQGLLKILALHPEAVRKAQREIDSVVGAARLPSWQDEASLPYVKSLIKEVHRYAPIGTLGIPHCATTDDVYDGKCIPKGTIVFPNLTAMSKDPERYHDPEQFQPDRFKGDHQTAAASAQSTDYRERDHFHYGFGRRLCPGLHVAEASLFIVISRILWGFHIRPKPGHVLDMDAKVAILISKPKPYQVDLECRGPSYEEIMRNAPHAVNTGVLSLDDVASHTGAM